MRLKKLIYVMAASVAAMFASCNSNANNETNANDNSIEIVTVADMVKENIMSRKSVRKFLDEPVPNDVLESVLKAGMAAPSAMNRQPWAIEVVNDKEILNGLSAMLPYGRLETAPVAIIVCGDMSKTLEGDARDFWVVDCSMMAENILLAAHAHGLGAVFTGAWPTKERGDKVKEYLGMPENYEVLGVIPMGYPAENPEPKDKWNPDAVHYNVWK
ncbi:MAG: nitroreductase family protein [Bacteroidales bacterium]|nr:nitroreductase family protein [Bacteroidales bacterium]